ncbi:MAG: hypothetical protein ACE5EM_01355 [Sphingomonadales bacterium]
MNVIARTFLALAVVTLGACALTGAPVDTPAKKLAAAKTGYTAVLNAATQAAKTGLLSDRAVIKIEASRIAARAAIDTAERYLGDRPDNAFAYIDQALTLVAEFERVWSEIKGALRPTSFTPRLARPSGEVQGYFDLRRTA